MSAIGTKQTSRVAGVTCPLWGCKADIAACRLGLEGIVSKRLTAPYRSGPSKSWIKVKNPKAPAATRNIDGSF